ncbi:putative aspartic proteinase GIP2 [Sesamum angolense]|uniref:Aspartic proteinase GIP2 n=1 Tax=Sesamum angolense TaxID=2727404 RepID=A0AAE2C2Y1_9LAMI|nr:putative aspartic proteinase GIP2 [Sesamum angolense]
MILGGEGRRSAPLQSTPYTALQTVILDALVDAFIKESAVLNLTEIAPVKLLSYAAEKIESTRVGPAVPTIDLVLQNESVF